MNCPNCGTPTSADQQFCRACGESLWEDKGRRPIPIQFWGLTLTFAGILIAMGGKLADLRWLIFAGVFISIAGMFTIAALPLLRRSKPRKRHVANLPENDPKTKADTTNKLQLPLGENDFIPSVVEGTTELLKTPTQVSNDKKTTV